MLATRSNLKNPLTELPRATLETFEVFSQLPRLIRRAPDGKGQAVLTLPDYDGSDDSMRAMHYFLKRIGYKIYSMDLGRNYEPPQERIKSVNDALVFRKKMVSLIVKRVDALYEQTGQPIALIGWSMGGCYALDVSQKSPDKVKRVITLGSTFGDPRGTALWPEMRVLNRSNLPPDDMNFGHWLEQRTILTKDIPIDVMYSPLDGIVDESMVRLPEHPCVTHTEIDTTDASFVFNALVYRKISQLLAQ
jgi:pimeloyl-ACP methyl ester carboxylesterase